MICPSCGSDEVKVQIVSRQVSKKKRGCIYWLLIGWWWDSLLWLCFPKDMYNMEVFGTKQISTELKTCAICQNCGSSWYVKK